MTENKNKEFDGRIGLLIVLAEVINPSDDFEVINPSDDFEVWHSSFGDNDFS
jgi:hypothetical protein